MTRRLKPVLSSALALDQRIHDRIFVPRDISASLFVVAITTNGVSGSVS